MIRSIKNKCRSNSPVRNSTTISDNTDANEDCNQDEFLISSLKDLMITTISEVEYLHDIDFDIIEDNPNEVRKLEIPGPSTTISSKNLNEAKDEIPCSSKGITETKKNRFIKLSSIEKHLFWEGKLKTKKRKNKEPTPSCLSSTEYRKFVISKQKTKKLNRTIGFAFTAIFCVRMT